MNYTEKIKELFERLSWINRSEFAKVIEMNHSDLVKYVTGKKEVSEKTYNKLMTGLAKIKSELP